MISTKTVKIKRTDKVTADYIENELKEQGLEVLRWAITGYDENYFIIDAAIING